MADTQVNFVDGTKLDFETVMDNSAQRVGIALAEYLCGNCPDAHQFVVIAVETKPTGRQDRIAIADPISAQAVVRQLLDTFFGVDHQEFDLAMDMIETRRRLKFATRNDSGTTGQQA